jgi:hypothetical protein
MWVPFFARILCNHQGTLVGALTQTHVPQNGHIQ